MCDTNAHVCTEAPTTTTSLSTPSISIGCVKCGVIKKSGKRSCCARGGDWFKNCGHAGDTQFNHTWIEGVRACDGVVSAVLVESPLQAMLHQVGITVPPLNTTLRPITGHHQADSSRPVNMFNVGVANSEGCVRLAQVVVCMCAWFVLWHLQT